MEHLGMLLFDLRHEQMGQRTTKQKTDVCV